MSRFKSKHETNDFFLAINWTIVISTNFYNLSLFCGVIIDDDDHDELIILHIIR